MKKLVTSLLFVFIVLIAQAQVLDTISLDKFKTLNYNQLKAMCQNDTDGLELIKKSHKRKINSYVFLVLSVPFAAFNNPIFMPLLATSIIKYSNNTKVKLYQKLSNDENSSSFSDTILQMQVIDSNSSKFRFDNYIFNMSYEDFDKLSRAEMINYFNVNDTTQAILEDYRNNVVTRRFNYSVGTYSLGFGLLLIGLSAGSIVIDGYKNEYFIPIIATSCIGISFTSLSYYLFRKSMKLTNGDIKLETYNALMKYYTTHQFENKVYLKIRN
jgi:hypothetical protein